MLNPVGIDPLFRIDVVKAQNKYFTQLYYGGI
jgi:hypothetical protein